MKRWSTPVGWMRDDPEGEYVEHDDALDVIASLRDRLAKAEAELERTKFERRLAVASIAEERDRAVATIAGYERRSYGWPKGDPENTYADATDYARECELEHGVTFDWEVAAVIRTERYSVVEHRDEEGNWLDTTAGLVTDSANPLPEAPRA